jgi:hypothetical protein
MSMEQLQTFPFKKKIVYEKICVCSVLAFKTILIIDFIFDMSRKIIIIILSYTTIFLRS